MCRKNRVNQAVLAVSDERLVQQWHGCRMECSFLSLLLMPRVMWEMGVFICLSCSFRVLNCDGLVL